MVIYLFSSSEILELEKNHGVELGDAYNNDRSCGAFIDYMGKDIKVRLNADLVKAKFFSVLCDGSTDAAVLENWCMLCTLILNQLIQILLR